MYFLGRVFCFKYKMSEIIKSRLDKTKKNQVYDVVEFVLKENQKTISEEKKIM